MGLRTYIIEKRHKVRSNYSYLRSKVGTRLHSFRNRVFSRFNNSNEKVEAIPQVEISQELHQEGVKSIPIEEESKLFPQNIMENIKGDLNGDDILNKEIIADSFLVKIIVQQGKIVQKDYLTFNGKIISLKF